MGSEQPRSPGDAFGRFESRQPPELKGDFGIERVEQLDLLGDDAGPAGLVAGADPGAVVAVEVFVEQQVVAEVRVFLKLFGPAERGSAAIFVAEEQAR